MEKLIEDLIIRLERESKYYEMQILDKKKEKNTKIILFLSGKITSLTLCINELKRLINYRKGL
ncbi:MAG: hypothetical protein A2X12_05240 [Bacteroidetes bacterium GWE2_29_8]|nr:MAG: hypothetical protein A2X12_05240 [Bacteroidetes bacterium GWE2_29_8]OFY25227.1 MAG: hypothetical protein A2X02_04160 [Bacteroidetes bacterium GWF2_29_10]